MDVATMVICISCSITNVSGEPVDLIKEVTQDPAGIVEDTTLYYPDPNQLTYEESIEVYNDARDFSRTQQIMAEESLPQPKRTYKLEVNSTGHVGGDIDITVVPGTTVNITGTVGGTVTIRER